MHKNSMEISADLGLVTAYGRGGDTESLNSSYEKLCAARKRLASSKRALARGERGKFWSKAFSDDSRQYGALRTLCGF